VFQLDSYVKEQVVTGMASPDECKAVYCSKYSYDIKKMLKKPAAYELSSAQQWVAMRTGPAPRGACGVTHLNVT
jgi:hypothetical protein